MGVVLFAVVAISTAVIAVLFRENYWVWAALPALTSLGALIAAVILYLGRGESN